MKRYATEEYVLGVTATTRNVHAVLVHDTDSGPVIVRQFHRTIGESHSYAPLTPELSETGGSDISFNIGGDSGGSSPLFLAGEFGRAETTQTYDAKDGSPDAVAGFQSTVKFDLELLEIISECQDAGFSDFRIAFAIGSSFIKTSEIKAPNGKSKKSTASDGGMSNILSFGSGRGAKNTISGVFAEKHDGEFDPGKVIFLPMKSNDPEISKALAVFAASHEPVEPTLQTIRDRKRTLPPIELHPALRHCL
jgi:hypothetical protein